MRIFLILLAATVLISACEKRSERIAFDEQFYKTKAKKAGDDPAVFQISVSPVSVSLEGARQAGRYEATRYCIGLYGSSDVSWAAGPKAEASALNIDNDTMYLRGTCEG